MQYPFEAMFGWKRPKNMEIIAANNDPCHDDLEYKCSNIIIVFIWF